MLMIEIFQAGLDHSDELAPLFSAYRQFYAQKVMPDAERTYLSDRMSQDECTIFLARSESQAAGFVLLYPGFDSVDLAKIWVLHDLYVSADHRRLGIGRQLMEAAHTYCKLSGASRIDLSTAVTNTVAQPLYESMGYERDTEFFSYSLTI